MFRDLATGQSQSLRSMAQGRIFSRRPHQPESPEAEVSPDVTLNSVHFHQSL